MEEGELAKVNNEESSFPDLIHPLDKPLSRILIERANGAFFSPGARNRLR